VHDSPYCAGSRTKYLYQSQMSPTYQRLTKDRRFPLVSLAVTKLHLCNCLHKCINNVPYKAACTISSSLLEHKMFETCSKQEELNQNINLKKCILLVNITYFITMHGTKYITYTKVLSNLLRVSGEKAE